MNIHLRVPITAIWEETGETSPQLLASLDGLSSDEKFSDYLIDEIDPLLVNLPVSGGCLTLLFDAASSQLFALISYGTQRRLVSEEVKTLVQYTLGQLSDGIGENFVQDHIVPQGVFLDLSAHAYAVSVEYSKE